MQIEQCRWTCEHLWEPQPPGPFGKLAQLVLIFASPQAIKNQAILNAIKKAYPKALYVGCSTAGEIFDTQVTDQTLVSTALAFDHSHVCSAETEVSDPEHSYEAGKKLAAALPAQGLRHTFVLSDGILINGSELVRGIIAGLPEGITVTGGLSADEENFQETFILHNDNVKSHRAVIVGFYGDRLHFGYGSLGGWDPFGPERLITRSKGNVLYEFDNQSALNIYKQYLGDKALSLPSSGLYFPISLWTEDREERVVRTILSINEEEQSLTFAGDVPQGAYAQLMKANFDRLIDGATGAAQISYEALDARTANLALLISCVGRKMVLRQRVEEEIESVREVLGPKTILTGFYSYGEISPMTPNARCSLHNQTMTITTISED